MIDNAKDPKCTEYDASHGIYMHFKAQWGCNGITNTNRLPGWWFAVSYLEDEGK